MKKAGITFAELRELLLDLGFSESLEEKKATRFTYPATRTFLLFRAYRPKEIVHIRDMLVVRRQLVDNGLIEPAVLESFLQKASA
jgi:hypothetical protein